MSALAEPLSERAILDGHADLLDTFREFAEAVEEPRAVGEDPAVLRGAVAFLRESLIPFARREERSLPDLEGVADGAAFEHAFLAAETEILAAEATELLEAPAHSQHRQALLRQVRRRIHRLEAVLELHVQKHRDREDTFLPTAPAPAPAPERAGHQAMTREDTARFLRTHDWGMLCTVGEGRPYAVPVSYGFDGEHLYFASGPGRKARNLETDARVCLTVADVESGSRWASVVVAGEAAAVTGAREKMHAVRVLGRQRGGLPSPTDLARLARARILRIEPAEISGRSRG